ncbi:MAG: type II toxin-antitoxin system RelE/ParE family toxin [Gammaproteobacteria bacterium]|nr:type II toxin-antitoxin system RelE/ParE family toxin [Gammaproteobacteria bacterium]MBU1655550.1 type II toxin-antitoxin system RelE/ParE family toxin [Gammaproteobacteria bacterium]MBU1960247.1 type II toxin-antitoxin system RelE/ParE family toxin [Gammaproteobacteria bacterium]
MDSLRYTHSAENDLLEAWLFIAEENPEAADRVLDAIAQEARNLLSQPKMGRQRPELAEGLRSWPTKTPYVLFYFVEVKGILIARALHHARDADAVTNW